MGIQKFGSGEIYEELIFMEGKLTLLFMLDTVCKLQIGRLGIIKRVKYSVFLSKKPKVFVHLTNLK